MTRTAYYTWFIKTAIPDAIAAKHIFPGMAVAEALEESTVAYGNVYQLSELAGKYNNLFGLKYGEFTCTLPKVELPTHEWEGSKGFVATTADWPIFSSWQQAFAVRMDVLRGLADVFPHYAAALQAKTPQEYVVEVSKTWSTDPQRASNVLAIYNKWHDLLEQRPLPLAS